MNVARRALTRTLLSTLCPAFLVALVVEAGCLWSPNIEAEGYTHCVDSADCAAGRSCELGTCAPPPWNDDRFVVRQLFVVENKSEVPIPEGAAVPVRVGAGGLIQSRDLGVDGRFSFYDEEALSWRPLPIFRDIYNDHLLAWLPLSVEVPPGESEQLAWLETQTDSPTSNLLEDPERVFLLYDDFTGDVLSPERYAVYGTGQPGVRDGRVNVADNQRLVSRVPLAPPFSLLLRGKINGATCSRFYVGLTAGDEAGFEPPTAGFFSNAALEVLPEVAPTADSVPRPVGDPLPVDTAEHRYRIDVGSGQARFWVDDTLVVETDLRPPLEADALHFRVEVDDGCSFDVERLMVTPLPFETPVVTAGPRVEYQIFD